MQRLREGCGRPTEDLDRAATAWRTGGRAALDVLEHPWTPPTQQTALARTALATAWEAEELPHHGRRQPLTLTGRDLQLRLGHDGRWYPYHRRDTGWWPAGFPSTDPAEALADLMGLTADDELR